jgi:DNA-binding transcriptional regulator YdaS (Cro superfamily)
MIDPGDGFPALEEAIKMAGGVRKLATLIKRSPGTILYWRSKRKISRVEDALAVYKAVRGRVSKARLAPHAFGSVN